jgi:hypothetical protein
VLLSIANTASAACGAAPAAATDGAVRFSGTLHTWTTVSGLGTAAAGDLVYDTTNKVLSYCNGTAWTTVGSGGGGAEMNTTTMVANLPDAIKCNVSNPNWGMTTLVGGFTPFLLNGLYYYRAIESTGNYSIAFNSDGSFNSYQNIVASDCNTSITSLYASGKAFNFIGSSLASAAAPSGGVQFNNGSSSLAGDTAFIWDNTNKRLGIGTASPAQKLSVAGTIESTSGGVKFPDGTTQTTAASASSVPSGTWCGYRNFRCASGTVEYFSPSFPCAGNTLTAGCQYDGTMDAYFAGSVSGCPSGYTGTVVGTPFWNNGHIGSGQLACMKN